MSTSVYHIAVPLGAIWLADSRWASETLVKAWHQVVQPEGCWHMHRYEGFRPVAGDLVGFFHPRRRGCLGKHNQSGADKVPAIIVLAFA